MTKDTKNIFYYSQNKKPEKCRHNNAFGLLKDDNAAFEISYSCYNESRTIKIWRGINGKRVFQFQMNVLP